MKKTTPCIALLKDFMIQSIYLFIYIRLVYIHSEFFVHPTFKQIILI